MVWLKTLRLFLVGMPANCAFHRRLLASSLLELMQGNVKYGLHLQAQFISDFELIDYKLGVENQSNWFLIVHAAIMQSDA